MSVTSGLYYIVGAANLPVSTGFTQLSGILVNSGINVVWQSLNSASGMSDSSGCFISGTGLRPPNLIFNIDSSLPPNLSSKSTLGFSFSVRAQCSGIQSTGIVSSGYITSYGRPISDSRGVNFNVSGWNSYLFGSGYDPWGLDSINDELLGSLQFVMKFKIPPNYSGRFSIDSISLQTYYSDTLPTYSYNRGDETYEDGVYRSL